MTDEKDYRVSWAIDIYAKSPEEAAKLALKIQRDPNSTATIFTIHNKEPPINSQSFDVISSTRTVVYHD